MAQYYDDYKKSHSMTSSDIYYIMDDLQNIKKYYNQTISKYDGMFNSLGSCSTHVDIEQDWKTLENYYLLESENSCSLYKLGIFYENKQKYDQMKKYYGYAIERNYSDAMNNLGCYYYNIEKDMPNTEKYLLMGGDKSNVNSMYNLGIYYAYAQDYANMEKYYIMSITTSNNNCVKAMFNLGNYYRVKQDYINMTKYYLMAIDKNHTGSMFNLGYYYQCVGEHMLMEKYYLMAIKNCDNMAMNNLGLYYKNINDSVNMLKYLNLAIKFGNPNGIKNI